MIYFYLDNNLTPSFCRCSTCEASANRAAGQPLVYMAPGVFESALAGYFNVEVAAAAGGGDGDDNDGDDDNDDNNDDDDNEDDNNNGKQKPSGGCIILAPRAEC